MTREEILEQALRQISCAHATQGGNDYLMCSKCGLEWAYGQRSQPTEVEIARLALKKGRLWDVSIMSVENACHADMFREEPSVKSETEKQIDEIARNRDIKNDEILADRGKKYGDARISHQSGGRVMRGVLEQHFQVDLPGDIPPHIVALIMVAIKCTRAATPFDFEPDNYVDGRNYLQFGETLDPRNSQ